MKKHVLALNLMHLSRKYLFHGICIAEIAGICYVTAKAASRNWLQHFPIILRLAGHVHKLFLARQIQDFCGKDRCVEIVYCLSSLMQSFNDLFKMYGILCLLVYYTQISDNMRMLYNVCISSNDIHWQHGGLVVMTLVCCAWGPQFDPRVGKKNTFLGPLSTKSQWKSFRRDVKFVVSCTSEFMYRDKKIPHTLVNEYMHYVVSHQWTL